MILPPLSITWAVACSCWTEIKKYNQFNTEKAYAYFKLSHAVLEQHLGPYHTRTMTAARNLMKCNRNYFDNIPEYKKLWVAYVEDPYASAGGKKKKKKGKK